MVVFVPTCEFCTAFSQESWKKKKKTPSRTSNNAVVAAAAAAAAAAQPQPPPQQKQKQQKRKAQANIYVGVYFIAMSSIYLFRFNC